MNGEALNEVKCTQHSDAIRYFKKTERATYLYFSTVKSQVDTVGLQWNYLIKSGTEEWKKLESYKIRVDMCQMQESILRNISTTNW